ncbi:MAG: S41 family peptidase, partial [Gemmatimonadales bacterium]
RASDALARKVAHRVEALRAAGIDALVVDVTGNGGGSEWVDPVTRIFTAKPLRAMRVTGVRHPREVTSAAERLAAVEGRMSDPALSNSSLVLLAVAHRRLAAVLAELQAPCDRAALWEGRDPGCTQTVTAPTYATGVFDHLPDDALTDVPDRGELYSPFGRDVPAGVWTGPLYVLANAGSASATEAFVAMLQDNGAAKVLGERTYGAGCGYTDGGLPIELPNSGLVVWMPDCARFRIDGTNEIEGIEPDIPLPWSDLNGADRARSLAEVLAAR